MTLDQFEELARTRRAVRCFRTDPLPDGLLERLLDAARWAPSGYNLQPTRYVVVTDPGRKQALQKACFGQRQLVEAPVTVVFAGDRRVVDDSFEEVLAREREAGAISEGYEKVLRRMVPLAFSRAPLGLGWLWKALLPPVVRRFRPIPDAPAVHKRYWLVKQVMLSSMNFMLAAHAAGLATVPMEGFDEAWVRRALDMPRRYLVALVVPVGFADGDEHRKSRRPLGDMVRHERF